MMSLGIVVVPPFRTTTNAKDQPNQANPDSPTTRRAWRVWASGGDERVIGAERRHPNHTKNANATTPTTIRNSTIRRRLFSLRTSCRSRSTVPIHWSAGGGVDQSSPRRGDNQQGAARRPPTDPRLSCPATWAENSWPQGVVAKAP